MEKLDLTKFYKAYYTATTKPGLVEIEPAQYISITGKGDPSEKAFATKIEALYSIAYAIKFSFKKAGKDFTVPKLEGLWWYDEKKYADKTISTASGEVPRSEWEYRLLIRMPDFVNSGDIEKAIQDVSIKKDLPLARQVELFSMNEGRAVQLLHIGPFATEPESLRLIAEFMDANNLHRNGLHHEIYLSDFRKTEAGKLKTILREPVTTGHFE